LTPKTRLAKTNHENTKNENAKKEIISRDFATHFLFLLFRAAGMVLCRDDRVKRLPAATRIRKIPHFLVAKKERN